LPTSLTYIVLVTKAVHLGDLLRIWVRTGTKITLSPSDFQGPTEAHRTPQETRCFYENSVPISGRADSRDTNSYKTQEIHLLLSLATKGS
ncbi:hypothetical protein JTE90_004893, partial [Oedothorax gibbosus]